jgi:transmembrane sensor
LSQDVPQEERPQKLRAAVFLTVNQQITVPQAGSAEVVRAVDSERELAWARGQLVFEKTTVAAVVEEFNRYNQMQLRVADAALAGQLVSGVFDSSDPESFIAFLRSTANIRVARSEGEAVELASAN